MLRGFYKRQCLPAVVKRNLIKMKSGKLTSIQFFFLAGKEKLRLEALDRGAQINSLVLLKRRDGKSKTTIWLSDGCVVCARCLQLRFELFLRFSPAVIDVAVPKPSFGLGERYDGEGSVSSPGRFGSGSQSKSTIVTCRIIGLYSS